MDATTHDVLTVVGEAPKEWVTIVRPDWCGGLPAPSRHWWWEPDSGCGFLCQRCGKPMDEPHTDAETCLPAMYGEFYDNGRVRYMLGFDHAGTERLSV